MKLRHVHKFILTIAAACGLAAAPQVSALNLAVGDANYLGNIVDGAPANPVDEVSYINYLITLASGAGPVQIPAGTGEIYDRIGSALAGPFPVASDTGSVKNDPPGPGNNIDASGFEYVLGKYGGNSYVWFQSGGFSENVVLPGGGSLSHISLYNKIPGVPDGGSTLALTVLAAIGMGLMRRKNS